MHTSLSQNVGKKNNGSSSTGKNSYSNLEIDSSAIRVLKDVYSLSTNGKHVYIESVTQNNIAYFKLKVASFEGKNTRIHTMLKHPSLKNIQTLALYLGVNASDIISSIYSYAQSDRVARVKASLPIAVTSKMKYHASQVNRYHARQQQKRLKAVEIR